MGKIVITEFASLDGVMDDPGGAEGSTHGGWQIPYMTDEPSKFKVDELKKADALLLGRITYQGFAKVWPTIDAGEFSDTMNRLPKHVVSSSLKPDDMTWNAQLIDVDHIADLRDTYDRDILVTGSDKLVTMLVEKGIVDEYRIMIHPLIIGNGKRLFDSAPLTKLKLKETKKYDSGIVLLTYQPM